MHPEVFTACAPSNIALIKYMGKGDASLNLPANRSISLTLTESCTVVELTKCAAPSGSVFKHLEWIPELPRNLPALSHSRTFRVPDLGAGDLQRINHFLEKASPQIQSLFSAEKNAGSFFQMRTANSFPSNAGVASSASSFAALTFAAAQGMFSGKREGFRQLWEAQPHLKAGLSKISRQGSGSSCRSWYGPWVSWEGEAATPLHAPHSKMGELSHFLILVSSQAKRVPSSQAHLRALSSPLWKERSDRANQRASQMQRAIEGGEFEAIAELAWREAWEMHSLFHTAQPPFSYWETGTLEALLKFQRLFEQNEFKVIVTLDAGANVHVFTPPGDHLRWKGWLESSFPHFEIQEDRTGPGVRWC